MPKDHTPQAHPFAWEYVGPAIVERMDALGLSQAELTRTSGLSVATVRSFMNGTLRGEPRPQNLRKLEIALAWPAGLVDELRAAPDERAAKRLIETLTAESRIQSRLSMLVDGGATYDAVRAKGAAAGAIGGAVSPIGTDRIGILEQRLERLAEVVIDLSALVTQQSEAIDELVGLVRMNRDDVLRLFPSDA